MNTVVLSGRLGADPKVTNFDNGGKSASFNIAVTERSYKKQDGTEVPEKTDWFRIETGRSGIAGVIEKYLKKGSFVLIEGKLRNREWENKEGVKQYATVVTIENMELGPKNGEGGNGNSGTPPPEPEKPKTVNKVETKSTKPTPNTNVNVDPVVPYEDDLPF